MKLTGKCKEVFNEWQKNKGYENFKPKQYSLDIVIAMQNALIIEFFDSVGIYISLEWKYKYFEIGIIEIKNNITTSLLENDNRLKATNEAIEKANDLFNSK